MKKCKVLFKDYNSTEEFYGSIQVFSNYRRFLPRFILSRMNGDTQLYNCKFWDAIVSLELNGYNLTIIK